jgi:hypothetical protein|tara:strand:- start:344 stop:502 length:159 start_codon:yes stop_codon:yes gene_type:complete
MRLLTKINEIAKLWEKTRDNKYKKEWYRLIRVWSSLVNRKKPNRKPKSKQSL